MRLRFSFPGMLFLLCVVALAFGALSGVGAGVGVSYRDEGGVRPLAQGPGDRVWKGVRYELVWEAGERPESMIIGSAHAKVFRDGRVLVADYGDYKVKEIAANGEIARVFGLGQGQGPGELTSITDFVATEEGVWVLDASAYSAKFFDNSGVVRRSIRLGALPYRLVLGPGDELILMDLGSPRLFHVFDQEGGLLSSFGEFVQEQRENAIALDGWMSSDNGSGFVYSGLYVGLLASLDSRGEVRYLRETIDARPLPNVVRSGSQKWVDRAAPMSSLSLNVDGDKIFILSYFADGFRKTGVIDAYSLEAGDYLYSMRVPGRCSAAMVRGDELVTYVDNSVKKWRFVTADSSSA